MSLAAIPIALFLAHAARPEDALRHLRGVDVHAEVDEAASSHGVVASDVEEQVRAELRRAGVPVHGAPRRNGEDHARGTLVVSVDAVAAAGSDVIAGAGMLAYSIRFGVRQVAILPDGTSAWVAIWAVDVLGYAPVPRFEPMLRESLAAIVARFGEAYAAAHAQPLTPSRPQPTPAPQKTVDL